MNVNCTIIVIAIVIAVVSGLLIISSRGSSSSSHVPENATDEDVRDLVRAGKKIEAIKCYRAIHGVGLKEAKDAVERMT